MRCPECGSEVGPEERFCGNCGAPVEGNVAETESPSPEDAGPEGAEPPPPEETVLVEAPAVLEDQVDIQEEEALDEDRDVVPSAPSLPGAEEAADLPEGEGTVPPPVEEPFPPAATHEPAPSSPVPTQDQGNKRIWIIVAVVVAILVLCCCALIVGVVLLTQPYSTSMIPLRVLSLLL